MFRVFLKLILILLMMIALLITAGIALGSTSNATIMTVSSIVPPVGNLTLSVIDADSGLHVPMPLPINGVRDAVFSHDARRVLLFSGGDQVRLHMVDLGTGQHHSAPDAYFIGDGFQQGGVSWSPDGRYVMFTTGFIPGQEDVQGVYIMDFQAEETRRIHNTSVFAQWSPDSRSLAYTLDGDIHLIDVTTGETRNLTQNDYWHRTPRWSSNGQLIFEGTDFSTNRELIFMLDPSADSTDVIRLTEDIFSSYDPISSPDGRYLAFSGFATEQNPIADIYNLDMETGEIYPLQVDDVLPTGEDHVVIWSPDSQRLLAGVTVGGASTTIRYVMVVSDTQGNILSDPAQMSIIHGWSTDSQHVLYALQDRGSPTFQMHLYATPAETLIASTALVQTVEYAQPLWTLNGDSLAYIRRETVSTRVGNSASNRNMVFTSRVYMTDTANNGHYVTLPDSYVISFGYWR